MYMLWNSCTLKNVKFLLFFKEKNQAVQKKVSENFQNWIGIFKSLEKNFTLQQK